MMHDKSSMSEILNNNTNDPSNLINSIEKMKFYYNQAQELEQRRSSLTHDVFGILHRKEQLNRMVLEKISDNLNRPP